MKRRACIFILASLIGAVHGACSRGSDLDVHFEVNSDELRVAEVKRLANWRMDNRTRFPVQDLLIIVGSAEATEKNASDLAERRSAVVAEYFRRTGYNEAEIIIKHMVYTQEAGRFGEGFKRVELEMIPACTNQGEIAPASGAMPRQGPPRSQ